MNQNETTTLLPENTTDVLELAGVDQVALACLNLDTMSVDNLAAWLYDHGAAHLSQIERIELAERLTRRRFIVGAGGLLGAVALGACGAGEQTGSDDTEQEATPDGTRPVEHVLGTTEVPVNPQRVIALEGGTELQALLLLGITPIAAGERYADEDGDWQDHITVRHDLSEVELLRGRSDVNLELVAALEPDLIVVNESYEEIYDLLTEIAPTISPQRREGPEVLMTEVAEAIGNPATGNDILARIEQRKDEVRSTLPDDLEISLIATDGVGFLSIQWPSSDYVGHITELLRDVGVSAPEAQREFIGEDANPAGAAVSVNFEQLSLIDGQHLLIVSPDREAVETELANNELWQALEAVQNDRVRFVENYWVNNGPLDYLAVLDDLERFFIEGEGSSRGGATS